MVRLLIIVLLLLPTVAKAEWHEANSENFRVIAEQGEKDVREFTERLERYHSAMVFILDRKITTPPSPSNRVTIYVVRSSGQVQKLAGDKSGYLRGFYQARAGGSVAFISRVDGQGSLISQSEQILFHEYAHHIMHGASAFAWPRWLSEGFAEFFSTARFEKENGVGLGLPAHHRAGELAYARNVSIEALLDSATYKKDKSNSYDEFYGRSWLLYHYLQLSGNRKGQLIDYQVALANGASEMEAATRVFGDLKQLDKELNNYLRKTRMAYLSIPGKDLLIGPITVRQLRPGEAAMMPVVLESKRGVNAETAPPVLAKAEAVFAKYPNDPAVLAALAEAQHDAGNHAAAVASADKAIALDPANINAHVQKIYALWQIADKAENADADWKRLRRAITALNKIEPDHPIPLIYFYRSLQGEGKAITDLAAHGLERALELAPYDEAVRWQVVQQLMDEKKWGLAHRMLLPLANDPHNRGEDNPAIALLAEIAKNIEAQQPKKAETPAETEKAAT
jgi:tetratricopeptide (TPR) repeat protein